MATHHEGWTLDDQIAQIRNDPDVAVADFLSLFHEKERIRYENERLVRDIARVRDQRDSLAEVAEVNRKRINRVYTALTETL